MELLLPLAAIIRVIAIERLHLPVAPAAIMVVLMAAEVARRLLAIAAAEASIWCAAAPVVAVRSAPLPIVVRKALARTVSRLTKGAAAVIAAVPVLEHEAAIAMLRSFHPGCGHRVRGRRRGPNPRHIREDSHAEPVQILLVIDVAGRLP